MLGADVERIIRGIDSVRESAVNSIKTLAENTGYQIISSAEHAGMAFGHCAPEEVGVGSGDPMSSISTALSSMSGDIGNLDVLDSSMYTGSSGFNNSLGSPWYEINKLKQAVSDAEAYSDAHLPFNYIGEKAGMLSMLNVIVSAAIDAKWAIIVYHDYIQRGFDTMFNDNKPSVTFEVGLNKESIGNIDQKYDNNVAIPQPSIDPF